MKCDELEAIKADTHGAIEWVYPKDEVDAAIAELKDIIKNNQSAYYVDLGIVANDCEKLKARINELESIPHTDNSAVIDALETENAELKDENRRLKKKMDEYHLMSDIRRAKIKELKRALWLARAYRGYDNSILLPSKFMRKVWDYVERKCRAKAEEYK